jgi:hypothetical protein
VEVREVVTSVEETVGVLDDVVTIRGNSKPAAEEEGEEKEEEDDDDEDSS